MIRLFLRRNSRGDEIAPCREPRWSPGRRPLLAGAVQLCEDWVPLAPPSLTLGRCAEGLLVNHGATRAAIPEQPAVARQCICRRVVVRPHRDLLHIGGFSKSPVWMVSALEVNQPRKHTESRPSSVTPEGSPRNGTSSIKLRNE
ncbi:hypothetical protein SKAU_G00106160 [Synaphobranchus kaupii]|uniref:Uncharacterized protein n=1 Tax=Synaphobranchus kaupii TaxID=118154 RepID=A0A9Q1G0A2_SYNKA|nr:hypothetical protein SKAU_G00106160 [Synaphobranchus kaupii]